jgi:hypothetical protein
MIFNLYLKFIYYVWIWTLSAVKFHFSIYVVYMCYVLTYYITHITQESHFNKTIDTIIYAHA